MAVIIDGTTGVATPGVTDTGDLSVAGTTTLTTPLPVTSGGTGASSLSGIAVGNLAGGSAGTIPYQSTVGTTAMLATGTSGQLLTSNGASAAPTWETLTIPTPSGSGGATASGSVTLTSASAGAQSITPTTYGQIVTLPDATTMTKAACVFNITNAGGFPLKIVNSAGSKLGFLYPGQTSTIGLADNSTAAGVWAVSNVDPVAITAQSYTGGLATTPGNYVLAAITLDSDRTFVLIGSLTPASNGLYGIVQNKTTQTWGSLTLIRSNGNLANAVKSATDQILVVSCNATTALEAVVLTISGTTITVGTAATATLAAAINCFNATFANQEQSPSTAVATVGSAFIFQYSSNSYVTSFRAFTISGTTVTIGAQLASAGNQGYGTIYALGSTTFLSVTLTGSTALVPRVYSVSGTTITAGAAAPSLPSTAISRFRVMPFGSRWLVAYAGTSLGTFSLLSVSGTTVTASTVTLGGAFSSVSGAVAMQYSGSKAIVAYTRSGNLYANILTDTAGTLSQGTELSLNPTVGSVSSVVISGNYASFVGDSAGSAGLYGYTVDFSGSSPSLYSSQVIAVANQTYQTFGVEPIDNTKNIYNFASSQAMYTIFDMTGSTISSASTTRVASKVTNYMSPPSSYAQIEDGTNIFTAQNSGSYVYVRRIESIT